MRLNESFANYGQYLLKEYRYGADAAGEAQYQNIQTYLHNPELAKKNLVSFYYVDASHDEITYEKGGRVLIGLQIYYNG